MEAYLVKCIDQLRSSANKPTKFEALKKKMNERFILYLSIEIANLGSLRMGFDNHRNHQRPHIHVDSGKKSYGVFSVAIDNGVILHNNTVPVSVQRQIQQWLKGKEDCLKFIYQNIQKCKSKDDFTPLIDAINRYL